MHRSLDEIRCAPTDDVKVGFVLAYGEHKGEIVYGTVKAGALAINYNVPLQVSDIRTVEELPGPTQESL